MRSLYGRCPGARFLPSLATEDLAGLFLAYFRNLPWQLRPPVARCIGRTVRLYPYDELHEPLADALMRAWEWLEAEGMLRSDHRRVA